MTELTIIYFDYNIYSPNKVKVKKIIKNYGLEWQESKMKLGLSNKVIIEAYTLFKIEDKIIKDQNLKERTGSVGLWSNDDFAVKIIMFDKKSEDEHLPVLLVFKGLEASEFYHELMAYCASLGCTISKIVEVEGKYEEIFRKRINIELVNDLNSVEGSKKVLCEMFDSNIANVSHGHFTDEFITKWKECIQKYGKYTFKDFVKEMELKNEKEKEENVTKVESIEKKSNEVVNKTHKFTIKRKEVKNTC